MTEELLQENEAREWESIRKIVSKYSRDKIGRDAAMVVVFKEDGTFDRSSISIISRDEALATLEKTIKDIFEDAKTSRTS